MVEGLVVVFSSFAAAASVKIVDSERKTAGEPRGGTLIRQAKIVCLCRHACQQPGTHKHTQAFS